MKRLIGFLILIPQFAFSQEVPTLLDIKIGGQFPKFGSRFNKDEERPTTQFKVPNFGKTSEIFYEYEVVQLNEKQKVAIVTARRTFENYQSCSSALAKLNKALISEYQGFIKGAVSIISNENEMSKPGVNTYYLASCKGNYGAFPILEFQKRGIIEDKELQEAWGSYFEEK